MAALKIAENLRERIEKLGIPHGKDATELFVTISLGVATQTEHTGYALPKMLNDAADQALYKAKKAGRNRVCSSLETA
jgi:two-component system chemotaxis family response regulator WspR